MDCLGFNDAIQMRNVSEMTPAELGITYNFHEKKLLFLKILISRIIVYSILIISSCQWPF